MKSEETKITMLPTIVIEAADEKIKIVKGSIMARFIFVAVITIKRIEMNISSLTALNNLIYFESSFTFFTGSFPRMV